MGSIHISGVPRVARDCVGREAEGVVVVSQRNNSGATGQADVAVPARGEGGHGEVDEQLDGMTARSRIGEVADGKVACQLVGRDSGHSVSSRERAKGGKEPPGPLCSPEKWRLYRTPKALRPEAGRGPGNRR